MIDVSIPYTPSYLSAIGVDTSKAVKASDVDAIIFRENGLRASRILDFLAYLIIEGNNIAFRFCGGCTSGGRGGARDG